MTVCGRAQLVEFAAFVKLRSDRAPNAPPPAWQIPGVKTPLGAALFFVPATAFLGCILVLSSSLGYVVAAAAVGTSTSAYVVR